MILAAASTCLLSAGCRSPYYADRGAATGGLLGAATGAIVGHQSGNDLAGAAIGGAVGALGGAAIGDAIDAEAARSQAMIEQQMGRSMNGAVTSQDVVAMSQAGLSDNVIATHIRTHGVAQSPTAGDIIWLHQQGVSQAVITAMQQSTGPVSPPPTVVRGASPPVIIEEHYFGPPVWARPWPHPHWRGGFGHHHVHDCGPRVGWGFSFSHH